MRMTYLNIQNISFEIEDQLTMQGLTHPFITHTQLMLFLRNNIPYVKTFITTCSLGRCSIQSTLDLEENPYFGFSVSVDLDENP